ncbi:MAG: hypothetical protein IKQ04_05220 [Oscillospiraceae bacterium]|nr:hypothetical protein [Oscillospiraceae bacterium]
MPETIQDVIQELRQSQELSPQHQELLQAIDALEQASAPFRRFRRRSKLPLVKAADRARLMGLHQQIGRKAEALLEGEDGPHLKNIVRKLSNLASQNYRALLRYDPKEPKTLDSLEAEARTLVVHVGAGEIKNQKWGKNLSQRTPLAIYDSKGKKISGLFTEKTELRIAEDFDRFVEQFIEDSPAQEQDSLRQIFQVVNEKLNDPAFLRKNVTIEGKYPFSEDRSRNLLSVLQLMGKEKDKKGNHYINPLAVTAVIRKLLPQEMKLQFTEEMGERLAPPLYKIRTRLAINHLDAGIPDGARLDTRNAAMSTVADLLGLPNLLARARPMKLVKPDGTVIEGTFMAAAKGLDSGNLPARALRINEDSLIQTNGNGFRDIGDLQVLDYLCGNVDRHPGNLCYQFDEYNSFTGGQGFDNDCSMGTLTLKDGNGMNRLVGTKRMMAVSQRTYERIQQLQPAVLKYALRGYGLSEAELEAAGQRLTTLQTDLKREKEFYREYDRTHRGKPLLTDHVRILKDNQWMDYDAEDFYVSEDPEDPKKSVVTENLFLSATNQVKRLGAKYQKQQKAFENLNNLVAVGSKNRAVPSTALREYSLADHVSRTLSKRSWWGFSSDNYDRLQTAVENYRKAQKRLNERLKSAGSEDARRRADYHRERDAVVTQQDLEHLTQLSRAMRDAAQTYLTGKLTNHGQLPANASEYTRNRVEAAEMVLRFANERLQIRPEEQRMAQENEARAQSESLRHGEALQPEPAPAPTVQP